MTSCRCAQPRARRTEPRARGLQLFGPHVGNFAFEIGNAELDSETAVGFDASVRWRHRRFSGEFTYFHNSIDKYIFRNPLTEAEFERDSRRGRRLATG